MLLGANLRKDWGRKGVSIGFLFWLMFLFQMKINEIKKE